MEVAEVHLAHGRADVVEDEHDFQFRQSLEDLQRRVGAEIQGTGEVASAHGERVGGLALLRRHGIDRQQLLHEQDAKSKCRSVPRGTVFQRDENLLACARDAHDGRGLFVEVWRDGDF